MSVLTSATPKLTVGVSDLKMSEDPAVHIITHALGSCLGITVYDPVTNVGGMLHAMLPSSAVDKDKAEKNPHIFIDTGVPQLFRQAYALGAKKERLIVHALKTAAGRALARERLLS